MKRLLDLTASFLGLLILSPFIFTAMFLVWRKDRHSPFYIAPRVGIGGKAFKMVKLRSMIVNADQSGVDSTSGDDSRITGIGKFIRKYKLDELTQLWNVMIGDMSLVGPRPNVQSETSAYSDIESELLTVKPGITDFSSIVFSDEGEILIGKKDPDLSYNQLIRPWKSRLGLVYVKNQSFILDIQLIIFTIISIISKKHALSWIVIKLKSFNVDPKLVKIARRENELYPFPPPGFDAIVTSESKQ